ncbi:S15/NS1 [Perilla frutescens var. hirtella]|uniref:Small ribosomal subunit protein uS15c n=1 Tax=Perilla frutescens var. hirtella TaxID=608512 RepID=A0AAD4IME7_PERFH|nr:S15/NS1 [Perilla frutescens var. hirtella]KAH6771900.1 S15/NS1 [Perilla frutescens var. frutescens]KAH6794887.1 S15/NS1 [Perilla frutescens var. hirtella]
MAAITKRLLQLRRTLHSHARPNPYPQRHFSSSSDDHDDAPQFEQPPETRPSVTSSLGAVRASLQNRSPPPTDRRSPASGLFSSSQTSPPSQGGSTDDLRSRLSEFRSRSAPPPPPSHGGHVSLQELYERNLKTKGERSEAYDAIRRSMSKLGPAGAMNSGSQPSGSTPLSSITENLKNKDNLAFLQKGELSGRLAKVREAKDKERRAIPLIPASIYGEIHAGIKKIGQDSDQKAKEKLKRTMPVGIFGSVGEITGPPKDHLVEKYFHPDNMSSAEKMKLELAKVRDEFKMSESDCGSARVQVAQLTTKIKHLSTALHKKDKHSRKGLQAMVQQRKKLLKYLRRTDWDSYCLVLSKLGLRDNAEIKA